MARYGQKFKDAVVARLLPPESASLEAVSQKVGISVATLERWRAAALAANDGNGSPRPWSPAARLEAVIATAAMDEAARSAWCREHGLFPADLDRWKQDALGGLGEPRDDGAAEARQDQAAKRTDATQSGQPARRRIKELERDLNRKDKALAETAALLVLAKKLSAIFRNGEDA
jgi:transposase-like protein